MNTTKQQAYNKISQLIERFSEHVEEYKRGGYNEHQTRVDYINPFFKALGWDMDNEQGFAEAYREVIHEDKIKVGGTTKAPDYGFTLFGQRKFFVDAKKPAVNIKGDIAPAYQVRRYGWSAKVPLSIVTDFEEFSIYDCTKKPRPTDKASVSRIKYLTYNQYLEEFDFLWDVFAKENLPKGRFDKYVQSDTRKKGTATVDDEFLKSIEQWRTYLATSIALRNKSLDVDELNYAVQKIIDRIIFLRMCEDRGVEQYGNLKKAAEKGDIYQNLFGLYRIADDKYNSGLFDFNEDKITPTLTVDNKVMKNIIKELYYPECEYEFSVMPADILGSVYERFLGKTIRLTPAHYAKIEEKPEVRKAGGVYYTPKYIVDYIVENTVGKLVKAKTPKQVEKIKICDPACGSGSFLIGAYQYLLDWHLKYYTNLIEKSNKSPLKGGKTPQASRGVLTPDGNLTTAEKKRILLNNIFGVDIDNQAVEVTKLNLLLKALEGETLASINRQLSLFHERVLPNLNQNIKCGNSLIGPDFYDQQLEIFPEQIKKINAFDWKEGFPEIMSPSGGGAGGGQGGFDVVIGNPPYIRVQLMNEAKECLNYYSTIYESGGTGNYDIYVLFIEKALQLLKPTGNIGFILPHKFFNSKYGQPIRNLISKAQYIREIIHFRDKQVFSGATTYTCLLFLSKKSNKSFRFSEVQDLEHWQTSKEAKSGSIDSKYLDENEWNLATGEDLELFEKLTDISLKLGDISKIFVGLQTSADTLFLFKGTQKSKGKTSIVFSKVQNQSIEIENFLLKEVIRSGQIGRYWSNSTAMVLFPYYIKQGMAMLIPAKELKAKFPLTWKYLSANRELLESREHGKFKDTGWYQLYPKNLDMWEDDKIMLPYMIKRLSAFFDTTGKYFVNVTTGGFGIRLIDKKLNPLFITGLLNSKLLDWYLKKVSTNFNSGYFAANKQFLVQLPVCIPISSVESDIVKLVDNLLQLNEQLQTTKLETQLQQIQRTINHAEKKIDELVYELYGLTEEEIKIIEEN